MTAVDRLIGAELGDYRVVSLLGKGGMGAVYRADDLALRRTIALKVLVAELAEDPRARARFQREIDVAVAIEHPHIVPVYNAGFERPHFFIAMRLVPGPDLNRVLAKGGPLPEERALRILGQVANALKAVHDQGLVHRDVKPHNVLLWGEGTDDEHAMLTDFGIAKALDDSGDLTGVAAIGTAAYMAPEVCIGRSATAASDQYSLACMAYELLSGRPPFDLDAAAVREAHVTQPPRRLDAVSRGVSPLVADAVDRALSKDPTLRYPDVRSFVGAAKESRDAFDRSERITNVITRTRETEQAVIRLSVEEGLSDDRISQITEVDRTQVVRMRRRQARRALIGRQR
jgi:serine/threonine protein kinase